MGAPEAKKMTILRIYEILEKYSDIDNPLTYAGIIEYLRTDYGIECERKAVARNLSMLKEADFDIVSTRSGSFLESRRFEHNELRLLIDSVLSSRHINAKHSKDLIDKLVAEGGKHFKSHLKHLYNINDWQKSKNLDFFLNVEVLDDAIGNGVKVEFFYNRYGTDKKLHHTTDKKHRVSPYQLLLQNQHYFLLGKLDSHDNLTPFRLDKITEIRILEGEAAVPLREMKEYKNGLNLPKLANALPYLYLETPAPIELLCENRIVNDLVDWFGSEIALYPKCDEKTLAIITASPAAMIFWIMQYGESVQVLKPQGLVDAVKEKVKKLAEIYKIGE